MILKVKKVDKQSSFTLRLPKNSLIQAVKLSKKLPQKINIWYAEGDGILTNFVFTLVYKDEVLPSGIMLPMEWDAIGDSWYVPVVSI